MSQRISVTVAAVIQRDGRFLLVEEEADAGLRLNQPAATGAESAGRRRGA
jgi:hypothetical protein